MTAASPLRVLVGAFKIIEGASLDKTFTTGLRPWEKRKLYNRPSGEGKAFPLARFAGLSPQAGEE